MVKKKARLDVKQALRIERDQFEKLQHLAEIESSVASRKVTASDLIREAIYYYYTDNERMREVFRRSRTKNVKRSLLRDKKNKLDSKGRIY